MSGDAFFHLHVGWLQRADGKNAIAAAAYRAAERLDNPKSDKGFSDFRHKENRTLSTQIFVPKDAPNWAHDRNQLWQMVEDSERRKDNKLAIEIEFALPFEIPLEKRAELIAAMAAIYVAKGLVVDVAVHTDEAGDNPHVHMLMTTRPLTEDGFSSTKLKGYDQQGFVYAARKNWETVGNGYLATAGSALKLDSRSYAERGLDKKPDRHRGADRAERAEKRRLFAARQQEPETMVLRDKMPTNLLAERVEKEALFKDLEKGFGWPPDLQAVEDNRFEMTPEEYGQFRAYTYSLEHPAADKDEIFSLIDQYTREEIREQKTRNVLVNERDNRDESTPKQALRERAEKAATRIADELFPSREPEAPTRDLPAERAEREAEDVLDYLRDLKENDPEAYWKANKVFYENQKREREEGKFRDLAAATSREFETRKAEAGLAGTNPDDANRLTPILDKAHREFEIYQENLHGRTHAQPEENSREHLIERLRVGIEQDAKQLKELEAQEAREREERDRRNRDDIDDR